MTATGGWIFCSGICPLGYEYLPAAGSKSVGYAIGSFRGAQTMCGPADCLANPITYSITMVTGPLPMSARKRRSATSAAIMAFSSTFVDVDDDGKSGSAGHRRLFSKLSLFEQGRWNLSGREFFSGFALNQDARETASMGLAVGDYATTDASICTPPLLRRL